jgi:hypothetical protein
VYEKATAGEVAKLVAEDFPEAKAKFGGKFVELSGVVTKRDRPAFQPKEKRWWLSLGEAVDSKLSVLCILDEDQVAVQDMKVGDRVTIRGKILVEPRGNKLELSEGEVVK